MGWILYNIRELLFFVSVILPCDYEMSFFFEMCNEIFRGEMTFKVWNSL